jgi:LPS O-antigen subunit length determinant protein (WzzB/FepE family)
MEEIEVPTEKAQEDINEHARESRERWISWVALSSALIAALAAVTALLAGHHANEGMLEKVQASNLWAYYQSKGIEKTQLELAQESLAAQGKSLSEVRLKKIDDYDQKRAETKKKANETQESAERHMSRHVVFARGVTMFQIAIAIAAISVLTKRTRYWYVALAFAAVGVFFLCQGIWFPPEVVETAKNAMG